MLIALRRALVLIVSISLIGVVVTTSATAAGNKKPTKAARISITASRSAVLLGTPITIKGHATRTPRGKSVYLQSVRSGRWRNVARTRTRNRVGAYAFRVRPTTGRRYYRVASPATKVAKAGRSRTRSVTAERCDAMPTPTRRMQVWFTNPAAVLRSEIATQLGKAICATANGATINVAMYYMRTQSAEVSAIIKPLEILKRYRRVKINILLEGKHWTPEASTVRRLRALGTLRFCMDGCRNVTRTGVSGAGINHNKFVTISDMRWSHSRDPVVISSSANWSHTQLRAGWQTATMIYRQPAMSNEFSWRFKSMWACAAASGCASWNRAAPSPGRQLALEPGSRLWLEKSTSSYRTRSGGQGNGTSVSFSPLPKTMDPVVEQLSTFTCTPAHRKIRFGIFHGSASRLRTVLSALKDVQRRSTATCDVKMIVGSQTGADALSAHKASGYVPKCVDHLHTKFALFDVADVATGRPRHVVWDGSMNLSLGSRINDDVFLSFVAEKASGRQAQDITAMAARYGQYWNKLSGRSKTCVGGPPGADSGSSVLSG